MVNLYLATFDAIQKSLVGFLGFIPVLFWALVVFVVGWFISCAVGKVVSKVLEGVKFNRIFESKGWREALEKADIKVNASEFVGAILKWILVIVFLLVTVDILGLQQFSVFLMGVIDYLPNVLVAILIFVVTAVLADIVEKLVTAGIGGLEVSDARLVGHIAKWALWICALFAIMNQLKIAPDISSTLFNGLVGMAAIAFGLAFGLGGKDFAADILNSIKSKIGK